MFFKRKIRPLLVFFLWQAVVIKHEKLIPMIISCKKIAICSGKFSYDHKNQRTLSFSIQMRLVFYIYKKKLRVCAGVLAIYRIG